MSSIHYQPSAERLQKYLNTNIANKKDDLSNPRVTFNWGYHDAAADRKAGRPARDLTDHFDPYYTAGYADALNTLLTPLNDSSIVWQCWLASLDTACFEITVKAILESCIKGREYLFTKKSPRAKFQDYDWDRVVSDAWCKITAASLEQAEIIHRVTLETCKSI